MADTEWWQRGPIDGVPGLLQPVAHILRQVGESVHELLDGPGATDWNARPAGVASIAFHVKHITGVVDRLFTYARGEVLNESQFAALRAEGDAVTDSDIPYLLREMDHRLDAAVADLSTFDLTRLGDWRGVGRAQLPSTLIGCLVHGAEHAMRHVGQLSVTARIVQAEWRPPE